MSGNQAAERQPLTMSESMEVGGFSGNNSENNDGNLLVREDRNGVEHEFVEFPERLSGGEKYALSVAMYPAEGERMGKVEPVSTVYKVGTKNFPNTFIGQSKEHPAGNWEDATSPLAFLYSRWAARDPKESFKDEFYNQVEEETNIDPEDVTIEDYKASFPVRKAVWLPEGKQEMVRVSESPIESRQHKPWEDYYLPKEWTDNFGGTEIPVWKDEAEPEDEDETEDEDDSNDSESGRGNYNEIGENSMDLEQIEEDVKAVDLSGLRSKKAKIAAIMSEVAELQGSLPGKLRGIVEDYLNTSSSTVYEGQDLYEEEGDPRENIETGESNDEETEDEDDNETMTEDNTEADADESTEGKGTKFVKAAVQHKPESVLDLLMEAEGDMVFDRIKSEYEEELEAEFGEEEVDEEEVLDEMFEGL